LKKKNEYIFLVRVTTLSSSVRFGKDDVSWGNKIPKFRGNLLSAGLNFEMSSSRTYRAMKTRKACCRQITVYSYQFAYSHVQKKGNLRYTESKKKRNSKIARLYSIKLAWLMLNFNICFQR